MRMTSAPIATLFTLIVVLALHPTPSWGAEKIVRQLDFDRAKADGQLGPGEIVRNAETPEVPLLLIKAGEQPMVPVVTINNPEVGPPLYMVRGEVRYADVKGTGFLEVWNHLADKSAYFTRGLAPSGPMGSLHGTSNWRDFQLPFNLIGPDGKAGAKPIKLQLNVVLPEGGTVYLRKLELVQLDATAMAGAWWSSRTAGIIGAVIGTTAGCFGVLIGILASLGRGRVVVMGGLAVLLVGGAGSLLAGAVALIAGQPYEVYFLLLVTGVVCVAAPLINFANLRRQYQQLELRRMEAMDVT